MVNIEIVFKTTGQSQLCIFYRKILPYNPILGSYERIQHSIILDLALDQFYLNINYLCYIARDGGWTHLYTFICDASITTY